MNCLCYIGSERFGNLRQNFGTENVQEPWFNLTLLTNVFAADFWWSTLMSKNDYLNITFVFFFFFIAEVRVFNFLLLRHFLLQSRMAAQLKALFNCTLYSTGVNLHFLQAYSFHFWCEKAFTFAKNRTFLELFLLLKTIKQVQLRKSRTY